MLWKKENITTKTKTKTKTKQQHNETCTTNMLSSTEAIKTYKFTFPDGKKHTTPTE
jgi:hypothetical protein